MHEEKKPYDLRERLFLFAKTRFFLRVISGTYLDTGTVAKDIRESEEIINILK